MRSHSVLYARQEGLPDWLAVLQHELGGDEFDGRDDLLMLSAVLDELDTVVAGALLGPRHERFNREVGCRTDVVGISPTMPH